MLVYSGTVGFRHISIDHAKEVIGGLATSTGQFSAEFIDQPAQLTRERLASTDVVLWLHSTGANSPFTDEQERDYVSWVGCGGGHIGVHASADSYKDWPEWLELTGAFFRVHPVTPTSAADDQTPESEGWGEPEANILVKDRASSLTAPWHAADSFTQRDEYYAWDRDPAANIADFHPLLAFGGFTDPAVAVNWDSQYAEQQPLSWTGSFRHKNRIYYTNFGHSVVTWDRADFKTALTAGISWVGEKRPDRACLGLEGATPPPEAGCQTKRRFGLHVRAPKGFRARSATLRIGSASKRVKVKRVAGGRLRVVVDLRGRRAGTVRVRLTIRGGDGRTVRTTRTYRLCAAAATDGA